MLTLLDANGKSTGKTATTEPTGFYQFDDLTPGTYGVAETQPAGYYDGLDAAGPAGGTAHNPGDLIDGIPLGRRNVGQANTTSANCCPPASAASVFVDSNGNNAYDSGEPLLGGVTIYLLDGSGNRIASTTTDSNGKYSFTDLKPGVYGVEEIQPAGYLEGSDQVGSAGGTLDGPDRILDAQLDSGRQRRQLRFLGSRAGEDFRLRVPGRADDRAQAGRSDAEYPGDPRRQAHAGRHAAARA